MSYCVEITFEQFLDYEHNEVVVKKRDGYTYERTDYYCENYKNKKTGEVLPIPHHIAIGSKYYKVDMNTYAKIRQTIREAKKN